MNLFEKLFSLRIKYANNPLEDFLTEVFAECLRSVPGFLRDFLGYTDIKYNYDYYKIKTQESFKALTHHSCDSQPDISIYLPNQIIFIENKVDSKEGHNQLKRYAEHLDQIKGKRKRVLLYITRDFDKKSFEKITAICQNEINFKQLRWHEVYRVANNHSDNQLIIEFLKFMEKRDLSSTNQFQPLDIIALTNFSRVKRMMDESMYGPVEELFIKEMGGISKKSASMTQLRDHDRYIYKKSLKNDVWVGLGYWLNSFNDKQYPELRFIMEVAPKSNKYHEIKSIMGKISDEDSSWQTYNFSDPNAWAGIYLSSSLKQFLTEENHIKAIQTFFIESIETFKSQRDRFKSLT